MRKFSCLSLAASLIAGIGWAAQATVIFTSGNNPQPGEENIQFESQQTGTIITGDTNQTGTAVQFTSTQSLTSSGQGQAALQATSGNITGTVTFSVPGHDFMDYIFNPQVGGGADGGTATITAMSNDGPFTHDITLGNGNNFWTITTSGGEFLSSVALTVNTGNYNQYQQPRVSGVCTPGAEGCTDVPGIPEPGTLALLVSGLVSFGIIRRRQRS
jgi:hypothetical protein